METPIYQLEFKVRDYECDLQGIVNNANYQHYYEHTRHEFLLEHAVSFDEMHQQGIDFVVARVEINFKTPLHSKDTFLSTLNLHHDGIRYCFHQKIYRLPDMKLCNIAHVDCVILDNGKLVPNCPIVDELMVSLQK